MGEAILALHRAGERRFELGRLRTGSIRDQVLRATLLADALVRHALVQQGHVHRGLLVIGGGVAGCALALRASRRRVHVTLLEPDYPMHTQRSAGARWIDPVEFDFPQPHWRAAQFPVPQPTALARAHPPLAFPADRADHLGLRWQSTLAGWVRHQAGQNGRGRLDILRRAANGLDLETLRASPVSRSASGTLPEATGVRWMRAQGDERDEYGAVVACTGFGTERVSLPKSSFSGRPFWARDRLHELTNLDRTAPRLAVLVSGGGDGAQQDFLRATTGLFGRRLYDRLQVRLDDTDRFQLLAIEDECRRAHAWRDARHPARPDLLSRWHAAYLAVAERAWQRWQPAEVQALAADLLHTDVTWLLDAPHPTHCYGLNRLMVLLVARLVHARDPARPWCPEWQGVAAHADAVIQPDCPAQNVTCRHAGAPSGTRTDDDCFGLDHEVMARRWPRSRVFQLVVLRHGLQRSPPFFDGGAAVNEQLVPYGLP